MLYTPLTNKALRLAYAAHHAQTDKCGQPYVFHPYHLAEQMTDEVSTCAVQKLLRTEHRLSLHDEV